MRTLAKLYILLKWPTIALAVFATLFLPIVTPFLICIAVGLAPCFISDYYRHGPERLKAIGIMMVWQLAAILLAILGWYLTQWVGFTGRSNFTGEQLIVLIIGTTVLALATNAFAAHSSLEELARDYKASKGDM